VRVFGGMDFCSEGNHAATDAYRYGPRGYCPLHPAPAGVVDALGPGYCQWGRGHYAADGVRWIPPRRHVAGRFLCREHMREFVSEIIRRGFWRT
jgi:hypothetical protein